MIRQKIKKQINPGELFPKYAVYHVSKRLRNRYRRLKPLMDVY